MFCDRKLGNLLAELKSAGSFSTEHFVFALTRFLENFQDLVIDTPYAGTYLATIIATAWLKDRDIFPPLSFLLNCGSPPFPDGEEDDFDMKNHKRYVSVSFVI